MWDRELIAIVEQLSTTMFDAQPRTVTPTGVQFESSALSACIELRGAFCGVLRATFSQPLARALASAMMAQSPTEVSSEDLCDVTGEFVNIVAGNLKALLPGPCQLMLPKAQDTLARSADAFAPIGVVSFELWSEQLKVELFTVHAL